MGAISQFLKLTFGNRAYTSSAISTIAPLSCQKGPLYRRTFCPKVPMEICKAKKVVARMLKKFGRCLEGPRTFYVAPPPPVCKKTCPTPHKYLASHPALSRFECRRRRSLLLGIRLAHFFSSCCILSLN